MTQSVDRIKERSQLVQSLVREWFPNAVFDAYLMGSDRVFMPIEESPHKYIDKVGAPFSVACPRHADCHFEGKLEIPLEVLIDDTDEALRTCVTKQVDNARDLYDDHVEEDNLEPQA